MTLARLLATALLFCPLPAFTQNQPPVDRSGSMVQTADNSFPAPATNPNGAVSFFEPWKIIPALPLNRASDSRTQIQVDHYRLNDGKADSLGAQFRSALNLSPVIALDGEPGADATCFAIRSYVVARDSKDSDSTHPAGYSTCRRASRYGLKTTVDRQILLTR